MSGSEKKAFRISLTSRWWSDKAEQRSMQGILTMFPDGSETLSLTEYERVSNASYDDGRLKFTGYTGKGGGPYWADYDLVRVATFQFQGTAIDKNGLHVSVDATLSEIPANVKDPLAAG